MSLTAGALTPPVATEGQAFTNQTVFQFTDPNPNDTASDYTAVVTLGDGDSVTLNSNGVVGSGASAPAARSWPTATASTCNCRTLTPSR